MERETILEAIRGCAEADGRAPGRQRFTKITGIQHGAWSGRYWARWSDALRDAGYPPNDWQRAYDKTKALERLASLIKRLGHFPTDVELRLERQNDKAFPSHNVFRNFGTRDGIARSIIELVGDRPGYEDVVRLCEPIAATTPAPAELAPDKEPAGEWQSGGVYLIKSGSYYKIGRSNATGRRVYELKTQLPNPVEVVHIIDTDDVVGIEGYWHRRFSTRRRNGEWFALSRTDVAAFKRRSKFM